MMSRPSKTSVPINGKSSNVEFRHLDAGFSLSDTFSDVTTRYIDLETVEDADHDIADGSAVV